MSPKVTDEGQQGFPEGKAPLCKEDSPIGGNVVEDDKRVTWLSAKLTEGLFFNKHHPISFVTKRNRVEPERKVLKPLQFAPANAVPLKGD